MDSVKGQNYVLGVKFSQAHVVSHQAHEFTYQPQSLLMTWHAL
jgi:hypothetical protein